jgi:putative transposase
MPHYVRAKIKGSVFFFTVVLAERPSNPLLEEVERLRQIYRIVQQRRPFETIAICVLPDHVHALWALPEGDADFSTRWSLIKSGFSRGLDAKPRSASKLGKREKRIWQRRYWEHAIRDDSDLARHVDYIHFNPVKDGHVTGVTDWPHSSFHRYVEQRTASSGLGRGCKRYSRIIRRMNGGHGAKGAFAHPTVLASARKPNSWGGAKPTGRANARDDELRVPTMPIATARVSVRLHAATMKIFGEKTADEPT